MIGLVLNISVSQMESTFNKEYSVDVVSGFDKLTHRKLSFVSNSTRSETIHDPDRCREK